MANPMKLTHINVVARNADALAGFYRKVFELELLREPRTLPGAKVSRGNGLANAVIRSVWLSLPGTQAPFLEIHFRYRPISEVLLTGLQVRSVAGGESIAYHLKLAR